MEYCFPQPLTGEKKKIWFGGDYNPEQWPSYMIQEDIRLMKKAGVNIVTLGVFAWTLLEPEEGVFSFEWLDDVVEKLFVAGIAVDMATATATPPRWLTTKHPEVLPCDKNGNIIWPGGRQHWRPTSSVFRKYALRLTEKMAEHYKNHPAIVSWHVSNELGCHNVFDYSEDAARGFQKWLKERYGSLEKLNAAWNGMFWSQMVTEWSQIIPPRECYAGINPTTLLDFKRFSSDALLEYYCAEREVLHRITPDIPVTTNLMVLENQVNPVDCFKWGKYLDFVSNDHYYLPDERHLDEMAMSAAIVSGIARKKPWFLMENSTSSVNWRPINLRKKKGEIVRDALIHVANGADAVCFFQWRQSQAGAEKFHSAMLPHAGENSRVYREICSLGEALEILSPIIGSKVSKSSIAMIYDYDSWWSYENGLLTRLFDYRQEFFHWYQAILNTGIPADVIGKEDAWEEYESVMFPVTFLVDEEISKRAERYVNNGGKLIITYGSGIADSCEHVYLGGYPGAFCKLLGVRIEEFVAIDKGHKVSLSNGWEGEMWVDDIAEISEECRILSSIEDAAGDESLVGQPVVTERKVGEGSAFYIGTKLGKQDATEFFSKYIFKKQDKFVGDDIAPLCIQRVHGNQVFEFVFNRSQDTSIKIKKKCEILYSSYAKEMDEEIVLEPCGVVVFRDYEEV